MHGYKWPIRFKTVQGKGFDRQRQERKHREIVGEERGKDRGAKHCHIERDDPLELIRGASGVRVVEHHQVQHKAHERQKQHRVLGEGIRQSTQDWRDAVEGACV